MVGVSLSGHGTKAMIRNLEHPLVTLTALLCIFLETPQALEGSRAVAVQPSSSPKAKPGHLLSLIYSLVNSSVH